MNKKKPNPGMLLAIKKAGSQEKLAKILKCTQPNIVYWLYNRVPAERAQEIEKAVGVPKEYLRPDLFDE